jgi:hypothetical protein
LSVSRKTFPAIGDLEVSQLRGAIMDYIADQQAGSRGAFTDQVPGSSALRALGATKVPAHAVAGVSTWNDVRDTYEGFYKARMGKMAVGLGPEGVVEMFNLLGQEADAESLRKHFLGSIEFVEAYDDVDWQARKFTPIPYPGRLGMRIGELWRIYKGLNLPTNRQTLWDEFLRAVWLASFGNTANDCTVRLESALGGLDRRYTSIFDGQLFKPSVLHSWMPRYAGVQQRVIDLLEDGFDEFAPDGFPPAGEVPKNAPPPPRTRGLERTLDQPGREFRLASVLNVALALTALLQVASPADVGTTPEVRRVYLEGMSHRLANDLSAAEQAFRKAIEQDPKYPRPYFRLGQVLAHQGKFAEAETLLRKAVELEPERVGLHDTLGHVLRAQGKKSEAEAAFANAERLQTKHAATGGADVEAADGQIEAVRGELAWVPITLRGAAELADANFDVTYDAAVVRPDGDPRVGELLEGRRSMVTANMTESGRIRIAFAQPDAIGRDEGTVMLLPLRAIGPAGSRVEMSVRVASAHDAGGGNNVSVAASVGSLTVVEKGP